MKKLTLHLTRLVGVCVFGLVMLMLVSACASVTQNPSSTSIGIGTTSTVTGTTRIITGTVVSVNARQHSAVMNVNGLQVPITGLTDQQVAVLQTQVGKTYSINVALPSVTVASGNCEPSGRAWVARFPGSTSPADLLPSFRDHVNRFIAALRAAGARVTIEATYRPPERAYLMHYSWLIARGDSPRGDSQRRLSPSAVPPMAGVNICWVHKDSHGNPDIRASRAAAEQMVEGYRITYRPALNSRHTQRRAIDMTITWQGNLVITDGTGEQVTITSTPRPDGAGNRDLWDVGESYGVIKKQDDPPHWSDDGH